MLSHTTARRIMMDMLIIISTREKAFFVCCIGEMLGIKNFFHGGII